MTTTRTQVSITGGRPFGFLLSQILQMNGIQSVVSSGEPGSIR